MHEDALHQIIAGIDAQGRIERAETQMVIIEAIGILRQHEPGTVVNGLSSECLSYRGYYSDLAFLPGTTTVGELLNALQASIGKTFEGYKGGDYTMQKNTPLWVSHYGTTGKKLIAFNLVGGELVPELADDEF